MNLNISDEFFKATEEYNTSVKKSPLKDILTNPHTRSKMDLNTYRRGVFYTCLRRYFNICKAHTRNYSSDIKVSDIVCTFNDDHTIKSVNINKTAPYNMSWDNDGNDRASILYNLKEVTDNHKTIYSTKALNDLAQTLNQL